MLHLSAHDHEAEASALVDHLLVAGIEATVRGHGRDGPWEVWVLAHDRIDEARARLKAWPGAADAAEDRRAASRIRRRQQREHEAAAQRAVDPRRRWIGPEGVGIGPVTVALCIAAVLVGMASDFGDPTTMTVQNLSIEPWASDRFLGQVQQGEVWRLLTPMLVHFGVFHLGFNLLWLWRFGQQIEHFHGTAVMVLVVVMAQVLGGLGQYVLSGPNFGGLSGVVYGTFGFVWMHARYDRRRHYALGDTDAVLMMLWFLGCATGLFGPIANVGHAGGLVAGLLLGLPPYVRHLRAHADPPDAAGNDWASVHVTGWRRVVRRVIRPYVPLWFLALAAVVIALE